MAQHCKVEDYTILHVYAQYAHHSECVIEGDRDALNRLRNAIDAALKTGRDGSATAMTNDGEGYRVVVKVRSAEFMEKEILPYYAP